MPETKTNPNPNAALYNARMLYAGAAALAAAVPLLIGGANRIPVGALAAAMLLLCWLCKWYQRDAECLLYACTPFFILMIAAGTSGAWNAALWQNALTLLRDNTPLGLGNAVLLTSAFGFLLWRLWKKAASPALCMLCYLLLALCFWLWLGNSWALAYLFLYFGLRDFLRAAAPAGRAPLLFDALACASALTLAMLLRGHTEAVAILFWQGDFSELGSCGLLLIVLFAGAAVLLAIRRQDAAGKADDLLYVLLALTACGVARWLGPGYHWLAAEGVALYGCWRSRTGSLIVDKTPNSGRAGLSDSVMTLLLMMLTYVPVCSAVLEYQLPALPLWFAAVLCVSALLPARPYTETRRQLLLPWGGVFALWLSFYTAALPQLLLMALSAVLCLWLAQLSVPLPAEQLAGRRGTLLQESHISRVGILTLFAALAATLLMMWLALHAPCRLNCSEPQWGAPTDTPTAVWLTDSDGAALPLQSVTLAGQTQAPAGAAQATVSLTNGWLRVTAVLPDGRIVHVGRLVITRGAA